MTTVPRYLTKSRFKMALECPTKLFYTGKSNYFNASSEDSFLAALAEGGYQVGALACLMFPGGVAVEERTHAGQLARTHELLARDEVTIYEAALQAQGLFVRVDILRKRGDRIELIEVKAKSYSASKDKDFRGPKGQLDRSFLPYLQDIAFQRHVAALAYPQYHLESFLMLADKESAASVGGLNQRFKVRRVASRVAIELADGTTLPALGAPILRAVCVDAQVDEILAGEVQLGDSRQGFADAVASLASAYQQDRLMTSSPGAVCGSCEFKTLRPPQPAEPASGFHECWKRAFHWGDEDFQDALVLDLWNFKKKNELIRRGVTRLKAMVEEDLGGGAAQVHAAGLTIANRQWFQISGQWPGGGAFYFDDVALAAAMRAWRFPLHFIDFETATVPIPFMQGRRPYETTAFQFSHHVLHQDGRVEHRSQFLDATPGVCPNEGFARALQRALSGDEGTVLRWAAHENTVLNHLRLQFLQDESRRHETADLVAFIDTLTSRKVPGAAQQVGQRAMVDLCKLAERHFFHPMAGGSSSLKKVLPALMNCSDALRSIYGVPVYGSAAMPSLNLSEPICWWRLEHGKVVDPYTLLPPIFEDLSPLEQHALDIGLASELKEGGSAMAAYARLQFEDLAQAQRTAIEAALLRYCELDTLAMVMAVQAWQAWGVQAR